MNTHKKEVEGKIYILIYQNTFKVYLFLNGGISVCFYWLLAFVIDNEHEFIL